MKEKNHKRIVRVTALLLGTACMGLPAMAASTGGATYTEGPTSNLWMSVVELPTQARISVTVPTSYGFAVVGSVETTDDGAVTSENSKVLLSNVRIEILAPSTPGNPPTYIVATTGLSKVPLRNYSTDVREEHLAVDNPPREGLPVEVNPFINEIPEALINGVVQNHYWKPTATDPTGDQGLFKWYRMGMGGSWFDTPGVVSDETKHYSVHFLGTNLLLSAPPDVPTNGWTVGGIAKVPSVSEFNVDVQVGGIQNQYNQVEQSVKISEIGWQIIPGTLPEITTP